MVEDKNIIDEEYDDDFDDQLEMINRAMCEGVVTLSCGCVVEPDGKCPCGNQSPLLDMGVI